MPAWSVPGIHSVLKPCIRFMRMRMSCSVLFSAWPRCRAPGHVRRRDDDRVRRLQLAVGVLGARLGVEVAALFPELVPLPLRGLRGRTAREVRLRDRSSALFIAMLLRFAPLREIQFARFSRRGRRDARESGKRTAGVGRPARADSLGHASSLRRFVLAQLVLDAVDQRRSNWLR